MFVAVVKLLRLLITMVISVTPIFFFWGGGGRLGGNGAYFEFVSPEDLLYIHKAVTLTQYFLAYRQSIQILQE